MYTRHTFLHDHIWSRTGRYFAQTQIREFRVETESESESACEPTNKTNSHTQTKNIRLQQIAKTNSHEYTKANINNSISQLTTLPRGGGGLESLC